MMSRFMPCKIGACLQKLLSNSASMKFKAFNANTGEEITSSLR